MRKALIAAALVAAAIAARTLGPEARVQPRAGVGEGAGDVAGVAYLAVDLRSQAVLAASNAGELDRPILPGSVVKVVTLAAALESGVIGEHTGILCTREVTVDGHRLSCTHPDFHRPLQPAEALAQSCNVFFATIGARLGRPAFDRALANLGLPLSDRQASVEAAAVGVSGTRIAPRALIGMMQRIAADPSRLPWSASTLAVVRSGLHQAARVGTAAALSSAGVDALAKTGTTVVNGVTRGVVVGVTPSTAPEVGFALLASGAAGVDAASLAAERLRRKTPRAAPAAAPPAVPSAAAPAAPAGPVAAPSAAPAARPAAAQTLRIGFARDDGGYGVRVMAIDDYVAGVVAGEMARDSGPAALEALAITARTFAVANLGRHRADGFDVCDLTHCQVFRKPTAATIRAANATAGRILLYRGAPASVFYTASCGGHSERPSDVWPGADDPEFLPSRKDDACEGAPAWSAELTAADVARSMRSGGFRGDRLRDLRVAARTGSGRVARLQLDGFSPGEISGQDFRTLVGRTLGWQFIKSTAFDVRRTGSGFAFAGHGSGHGVGLCVIGSVRLAERGQTATQILATYFPGLEISSPGVAAAATRAIPAGPDVVVALPAGDEGEREVLHDLAVRARDVLARELGVPVPPRITLRFHPTVESYQRATGQPWFTAGAAVGADMHFVPMTVLRNNGVLERTVRHEIVHVLTDEALKQRPLWVREGAASYYAGERAVATDRPGGVSPRDRMSCPTDQELRNPVSPGALSTAYARATSCFARQLAAGRKWTEVR